MAQDKDFGAGAPRITRIFPQWFKDLDSALKPVVSSVLLLLIAAPMVVLTIMQWNKAAAAKEKIDIIVAEGGSSVQLALLTDQFQTANHRAQIGILLSAGVAWFGAMLIAYSISKLSAVWLTSLSKKVKQAADGDLTTVIVRDNKSQVGDLQEALGKMIGSFHAIVSRIGHAADELRDAARDLSGVTDETGSAIGEVAHSVSSISAGAGNQVELIGATSNEVGAIEIAVREAAVHAGEVTEHSLATVELTEDGVRRAAEIELAIEHVRDNGGAMGEMIIGLSQKSTDIDLIVRSIADIAEQTNLLALNAAIEAARAGEQGRGFAVVAEEVRKLAEEAQDSTETIAHMTAEIRECTDRTIEAVKRGTPTVLKSIEAVELNRAAFAEISEATVQLNAATEEIARLADAIAEDATQVRSEIEDIASVAEESSASTQQVSAATEESAASAQEVTAGAARVAETASALARLVTTFKIRRGNENVRAFKPRVAQEEQAAQTPAEPEADADSEREPVVA